LPETRRQLLAIVDRLAKQGHAQGLILAGTELPLILRDAELAMGWRLRNVLANPGVALTWWDQAVWAEP
jgi:hypothetical protein